jgi:glucan phosphoethanolaminetransferase (alkaline phosphatase superfamily)
MINPNQISGYNDNTKTICLCTLFSIIIVILFILSPLSNFFKTSLFMKFFALIILAYTIYLILIQTNNLKGVLNTDKPEHITSQINTNIICSYIFTIFLIILFISIIKSFF